MNIESQQQNLINSMKEEEFSQRPSSFHHSVWFRPLSGRFLYADLYVQYEIVEPLIENKTLVFKSIENHQGEKMLRYVLS